MLGDDEPGRLADALTDPADREQQDRRGNRDEDVVEAGDEPELFLVGNDGRALALDVRAQRVGRFRGHRPGSHGVVNLLLAVHGLSFRKSAER